MGIGLTDAEPRDAAGDDMATMQVELEALRAEVRLLRMANAELERVVVRDTLTPLYNRRHFMNCMIERLSRLERYGVGAAVLFVDVNDLKGINDRHGHPAGDFALTHIATLLSTAIRASDVAARIGGDEFAIILDGVDETGAREKAAQLARLIASSECRLGDLRIALSASFGMSALKAGDSENCALTRADQNMYAAKKKAGAARLT
jgi:diguanylate cyclase (GGDEF)-like protein